MSRILKYFPLCLLLFIAIALEGCGEDTSSKPMAPSQHSSKSSAPPTYTGSEACADCHRPLYEAWQISHHAYSMQPADPNTVLGNFNDEAFAHGDQTFHFSRVNNTFMVKTNGSDGQLHEYKVAYTFGIDPLQQYLIPFSKGRLQALSIAWDTRSK
ncbi:MAG: cytochrome c family protein, partial [Nitrospirota bacterium]|nr:cytochrome c family protein [Nitrospirota bacterium]